MIGFDIVSDKFRIGTLINGSFQNIEIVTVSKFFTFW